ncbi:hypothetical protein [Spiroplasma tabanidicola]|uniref:Uncharacterized protein n=1 Tax=Spiroplasma tabanidicola TaxID=324079 RepID=A0A6I6C988_9MOLU|nr:hypothetical protein [Spiroplasma tabanidicola]QGS51461.1 hypothetical protein STABA_v1c00940 [Spiroplasma tabanidicola]
MKKVVFIIFGLSLSISLMPNLTSCIKLPSKIDINDILIKDLGEIKGKDFLPNLKDLVTALNYLNKNLDLKKEIVEFESTPTVSQATINVKSDATKFFGSAELSYDYKLENKISLSQIMGSNLNLDTESSEKEVLIFAVKEKIKTRLNVEVKEGLDFMVDESDVGQKTQEYNGSFKIKTLESSPYLIANEDLVFKYKL